jgi:predicted metal-dependent peptidase
MINLKAARKPTSEELSQLEAVFVAARQMRPYYCRALAALTPHIVDGMGTVAVDSSWRLYVDIAWLMSLPLEQRAAVVSQHEIEHLLRDHSSRAKTLHAEPARWNIAADAEINDDADHGSLPAFAVSPKTINQPDGRIAEEYYEDLVCNKHHPHCGGGSGAGVPLSGELDPDDTSVTSAQGEILREQVAADVRSHIQAHGMGSVPSGVRIWAEAQERKIIIIPWERELRSIVSAQCREIVRGRQDWSWARPARRASAVTRPGTVSYRPRIGVVVDTSGSMCERGGDVLGAVRSIARARGDVRLWQIDAAITAKKQRPRPGQEFRGGGGTDLVPALLDAARSSDIVIAITDCETPWPAAPLRCPTLVVTWRGAASNPEWCRRVELYI